MHRQDFTKIEVMRNEQPDILCNLKRGTPEKWYSMVLQSLIKVFVVVLLIFMKVSLTLSLSTL